MHQHWGRGHDVLWSPLDLTELPEVQWKQRSSIYLSTLAWDFFSFLGCFQRPGKEDMCPGLGLCPLPIARIHA